MKRIGLILILIITVCSAAYAQGITGGPIGGNQGGGGAWSDIFSGTINGTPSTITLQQNGNQIAGIIDASGYQYNIAGTVSGMQSQGQVTDTRTGGVTNYAANLSGDLLTLNLLVQDQMGRTNQIPIQFTRGQPAQQNPLGTQGYQPQQGYQAPQGGVAGENQGQGAQNVQRDQRLVGGWRHTESYMSGEFSMVSEWYMNINMDGTYTYGSGQAAGGTGDYSFDTGQGGNTSRGQWKTENGIVYINQGYGWQPYAGYYVDGASMMFRFSDGSKQLWERFR